MRRSASFTFLCRPGLFPVLAFVLLAGCRPEPAAAPTRFELVIGSRGHTAGKFNRPRGIYYDADSDRLFVVDWDGKIQKFTGDGKFRGSWMMPEVELGKPEDLCLTAEDTLLVTDTHYSRILEFTRRGKEVRRFGSYGDGDGQFIYPVGICTDREGFIYVSEYGDNNRVQKFTRTGEFVASFGGFGSAPGKFQRPSGIAIGPDGHLYITDAVNHRLQVFTLAGEFVRVIGKQGKGLGELTYPYDIDFRGETMYVLEFGNNRVQKMTPAGEGLAVWGSLGSGDGEFSSPWRFCVTAEHIFVSDTNNFRVTKFNF